MLPKFSGDKRTAYSNYPIWKKQWVFHIMDYEEKYRTTMLVTHLDGKAADKIVRLKNDYSRAMAAPDRYYNDCPKILAACIKEVKALSHIVAGDYEALVSYQMCIVNIYLWLSTVGSVHEVSNVDMMQQLVSKLLWAQIEKWNEYRGAQDGEVKAKPFELFLQ